MVAKLNYLIWQWSSVDTSADDSYSGLPGKIGS